MKEMLQRTCFHKTYRVIEHQVNSDSDLVCFIL